MWISAISAKHPMPQLHLYLIFKIVIAVFLILIFTACDQSKSPDSDINWGELFKPKKLTCKPAPSDTTGFSLVFKECDITNPAVATYFDKTECVRDNMTGLIWQGHTPASSGSLRDNDKYFTNVNEVKIKQFDSSALISSKIQLESTMNALQYIKNTNNSKLCGMTRWRLPSKNELQVILKPSLVPSTDNEWFPNSPNTWYWTDPSDGTFEYSAVSLSFKLGFAVYSSRGYKTGAHYNLVRLVHDLV